VRIIGIDPGTLVTGYGIVEKEAGRVSFVGCGCIRNRPSEPLPARFLRLHRELGRIFAAHRPAEMAIEGVFFRRNVASALKLGEARGIAMLVAAENGAAVHEYAPRRVKKAVMGRGGARKGQVQYMMKSLLGLAEEPRPADASDALALALCHAFRGAPPRPTAGPREPFPSGVAARPARGRVKG
jgi:crossover junction endodeoxyribonuclease RuvC